MADRLVLPPNDSPLERALAKALALADDLQALAATVEARFETPADEDLPFLIWEWGLQPVTPYLTDPRLALSEGRRWQKLRGTPQAGHIARGWIGISAAFEAELNKLYHLHLNEVVDGDRLDAVIALSRLSSSLRARLFRLTYNLDVRPLRGGRSKTGAALYSAYSGVRRWPGDPKLSFRIPWTASMQLGEPEGQLGVSLSVAGHAVRQFPIRYGRDRLPALSARPLRFSASLTVPIFSGAKLRSQTVKRQAIPRFAVVGGRCRYGRSIYLGAALKPGRAARLPFHARTGNIQRPVYEALAQLPMPDWVRLSGTFGVAANIDAGFVVTGLLIPEISQSADEVEIGVASFAALGADAPFSEMPFLDEPWGAGQPRALSDLTGETS
jgi:hypothetical protein